MSLRALAESDLSSVLEDSVAGFGWPVSVTDPSGANFRLVGQSNDISQVIDPESGAIVSGRLITVSLRISSLKANGLDIPVGVNSKNSKPWVFEFDDILGVCAKFKVVQSNPDRALGLVSCILELYK